MVIKINTKVSHNVSFVYILKLYSPSTFLRTSLHLLPSTFLRNHQIPLTFLPIFGFLVKFSKSKGGFSRFVTSLTVRDSPLKHFSSVHKSFRQFIFWFQIFAASKREVWILIKTFILFCLLKSSLVQFSSVTQFYYKFDSKTPNLFVYFWWRHLHCVTA
jgi:hypothetical protein